MSTLSQQREVVCPITKVKHLIVHSSDQENIRALRKWATSIFIRLQRNQKVLLSVDCEGWRLGAIPNSLVLLQICEFGNEDLLTGSEYYSTSVEIKPGFLIHFPTIPSVIDLLSGILSHPNVVICTYDFTSDIATLQEAGISIDLNCLYDAQLSGCKDNESLLRTTNLPSIMKSASNLESSIEEARPAIEIMKPMKKTLFETIIFLHRKDKNPSNAMIDEHFYEYAAGDLVMTALAFFYTYYNGTIQETSNLTQKKVKEFLELQKQNILLPSAIRQASFYMTYAKINELFDFYYHQGSLSLINEDDLKKALTLYVRADTILLLSEILPPNEMTQIDRETIRYIRELLEGLLQQHVDLIKQISPYETAYT